MIKIPDPNLDLREAVLRTIQVIAAAPGADENDIFERLRSSGHESLKAKLLVAFVPLGLARAIIRRLPSDAPIKLSETAKVLQADRELEIPLMAVAEFVDALRVGEETFSTGIISKEDFGHACRFSVELKSNHTATR